MTTATATDYEPLTEGPMAAWVALDDDGDPVLCMGFVRGEAEDSRCIRPSQVPDHLWEIYMELVEDFEDGFEGDFAGEDAFYAALGSLGRWGR